MEYDAVVVGAGPNGLSAAIELSRAGLKVCVLEANSAAGGGARTEDLTLPDFRHDVCSAIHPLARVSPFFKTIDLERQGVRWIYPPAALAHPLPDGSAAVLYQSLEQTAAGFQSDGGSYKNLMAGLVSRAPDLFDDLLRPLRFSAHPLLMAGFGLRACLPSTFLMRRYFNEDATRALFMGCAAHSILPLEQAGTSAFALMLMIAGHHTNWPFPSGGSGMITRALVNCLLSLNGVLRTGSPVRSLKDIPECRLVLFDVTPRQLLRITGDHFSARYRKQLALFRYGPAVFKIDWALNGPIPWRSEECKKAATVHVGGHWEEIAGSESLVWEGKHPDTPFVLVAQQSLFDPSRAPSGKQTGWAYCHVPNGSLEDMTDRIERQIERFAPGFRDVILARHTFNSQQLQEHNANLTGGDIAGGANNLFQLFFRPVVRWNPYRTPDPRMYLCSSSTSPGGGVHGMCGYWAARTALRFSRKAR